MSRSFDRITDFVGIPLFLLAIALLSAADILRLRLLASRAVRWTLALGVVAGVAALGVTGLRFVEAAK